MSFSWIKAADALHRIVAQDSEKLEKDQRLDEGQRASLNWIADRIQKTGVVLADEVGTGKTRIACAVVHAVLEAGGRVAVVVPRGLMHQWKIESSALRSDCSAPKILTTLTEFIREVVPADDSWKNSSPHPDRPEWWLISHGFRAPLVKGNSALWRAALPLCIKLHLLSPAKRKDRRTRLGKLQHRINKRKKPDALSIVARIAREITPHIRSRLDLRHRIEGLARKYLTGQDTNAFFSAFGSKGDGRPVTEELLSLWLGEFDLVVIDEAHKGRGEENIEDAALGKVKSSVLSHLINSILKQSSDARRICLTATPMELELKQWLDLLNRARCGLDPKRGAEVVERLYRAAESARIAPDEGYRLDELCTAAQEFSRTLSPYVTRRRRDEDPLIASFRRRTGNPGGVPHPHRHFQQIQIEWTEAADNNSAWLDVIFAAESMSESARGLSEAITNNWPRAIRDAYTKLAAGHVNLDLLETSEPLYVPKPGNIEKHLRDKIARVAYWYQQLRDGRQKIIADFGHAPGFALNPDAEHPRILAAVREIEKWTAKEEKVLVFGVFLGPLGLLRDVLNVRHALRAADAQRPISHAIHQNPALLAIAVRQIIRLRDEGLLTGRLISRSNTEIIAALKDSHRKYDNLRRTVQRRVKRPISLWQADAALFGGLSMDRNVAAALRDHLVSFIIDDFLAATSDFDQPTSERIDELAEYFLVDYLRPLFSELADDVKDDEQKAKLRHNALRDTLLNEDEGRQSFHARLLQGETGWETRQYLQAAFNRPKASPRVLIAQSQVGREGLNLHLSCRVVMQFHAEWNPAVLEQQIGRVDRKGSRWENLTKAWLESGGNEPREFVEVRQLIFEGTYDAYQWERVIKRQHIFDASLFGSLLPADAWAKVPENRRSELIAAAPSFSPPPLVGTVELSTNSAHLSADRPEQPPGSNS